MELDSTIVQVNSNEKLFYKKIDEYINKLETKFREKSVIKQDMHNKIQKCLLLAKGISDNEFPATLVYWVKHKFILLKIAGNDIVVCIKTRKPVCVYEAFYNVITEAHKNVSHGGHEKTSFELNSQYSWVPRFCIEIFLKQCIPCQTRKPIKQHVVSKPIISLGVMTRLQIDLIDMRTRPDKLSADVIYHWILNCIDHFSKFSWAFPLKNKSANEVALKLRELFFVFGSPQILHSDNGREFVSSVIMELKSLFSELVFIRGRPRHPQSQGCIERANGVLCDVLGKGMSTNDSSSWSSALLPVVYGINTRMSSVTKKTPYEVMFGQAPRSDSDFWKLVRESGINDEEHLPTPVDELNDDLIDNQNVNRINFDHDAYNDHGIDNDIIALVNQLSDEASSYSSINIASTSKAPASVTTATRHSKNKQINQYIEKALENYFQTREIYRKIYPENHQRIREIQDLIDFNEHRFRQ
jgi:hypothetical protein